MALLAFLFIVIPAVELALLVEIGGQIGTMNTFAMIIITGVVGAYLAKRQGLGVLNKIRSDTASGQIPAGSLVDGAIILVASALLVTPGILTDAVGFACLIPAFRSLIKVGLKKRFEAAVVTSQANGQIHVAQGPFPGSPFPGASFPGAPRNVRVPNSPYGEGPIVDVTPDPGDR